MDALFLVYQWMSSRLVKASIQMLNETLGYMLHETRSTMFGNTD